MQFAIVLRILQTFSSLCHLPVMYKLFQLQQNLLPVLFCCCRLHSPFSWIRICQRSQARENGFLHLLLVVVVLFF